MENVKEQLMVSLGKRLKTARELLRLNQTEFAAKMKMSNTHLSAIEFGKCGPGFYFFYQITRYYNINPLYLLHGKEPMFLEDEPQEKVLRAGQPSNSIEKSDWFGADSLMRENLELMKKSPIVQLAVMQFVAQYSLENKALIEADIQSRLQ